MDTKSFNFSIIFYFTDSFVQYCAFKLTLFKFYQACILVDISDVTIQCTMHNVLCNMHYDINSEREMQRILKSWNCFTLLPILQSG